MYVSLGRYDLVAKVINNGRRQVKNILFRKWPKSHVPGRRNEIKGGIMPCFSGPTWHFMDSWAGKYL